MQASHTYKSINITEFISYVPNTRQQNLVILLRWGNAEFGGKDVSDVKALFDYLPILQKKLSDFSRYNNIYLIELSRGAMQLFLTLARYPEIQDKITKIATVSGLLDIQATANNRADMNKMFIKKHGLDPKNKNKS